MKTSKGKPIFLIVLLSAGTFAGCSKDQEYASTPAVKTLIVSNISETTAITEGVVTDDGNAFITDRGVCWDVNPQPDISLATKNSSGHDKGTFESVLTDLTPGQQYYVRAYATNSEGTSYGNELVFQTLYSTTIVYREDGRTVKYGDPWPVALDVTGDGSVDFTIFVELTANSRGDRLYLGMNPIGPNLIKSGPPVIDNFLSMGYLIAETPGTVINNDLNEDQYWTDHHGILAVRNTFANGTITYEGNWPDGSRIAGIQNVINGSAHFGWVRISFNKDTETLTLVAYAFESISDKPVIAGYQGPESSAGRFD